jgi:excisionase family DNA binding protein
MNAPYTLAELAGRWHCHKDTVRGLIRAGRLPCLRITPRKLLVPAAAVEEYERTALEGSWPQAGLATQASAGSSSGAKTDALSASLQGRLIRSRLNAS